MATRFSRFRTVPPALVEQREAARHQVDVSSATVRGHGEEAIPGELRDVSPFGCRLGGTAHHIVGERLWLRLSGGMPIAATVMWREEDVIGCRFDQAIAPAQLRQLTLQLA